MIKSLSKAHMWKTESFGLARKQDAYLNIFTLSCLKDSLYLCVACMQM